MYKPFLLKCKLLKCRLCTHFQQQTDFQLLFLLTHLNKLTVRNVCHSFAYLQRNSYMKTQRAHVFDQNVNCTMYEMNNSWIIVYSYYWPLYTRWWSVLLILVTKIYPEIRISCLSCWGTPVTFMSKGWCSRTWKLWTGKRLLINNFKFSLK